MMPYSQAVTFEAALSSDFDPRYDVFNLAFSGKGTKKQSSLD
jgi:hypothetical protein